jgi:hypothetical protein
MHYWILLILKFLIFSVRYIFFILFTKIVYENKTILDKRLFIGEEKYKKDFIYFKLYNYLAVYGVIYHTEESINKEKYKNLIQKDNDFKIISILSLNSLDSVILGSILIKLRLFSPFFYLREQLLKILGISRK